MDARQLNAERTLQLLRTLGFRSENVENCNLRDQLLIQLSRQAAPEESAEIPMLEPVAEPRNWRLVKPDSCVADQTATRPISTPASCAALAD